jgi:hypothetical protein
MKRKASKILSAAIIVLYVSLLIVSSTSLFSISSTLVGSLERVEDVRFDSTMNPLTGVVDLAVRVPIRNRGIIEVNVSVAVKLVSADGTVVAEGSDSRRIGPGETEELLVVATFLRGTVDGADLSFECRAFFDLVGLSFSMRVETPTEGYPSP